MHEIQRFRVLGEIGSGGMGRVYRALDPRLEREVAIKVVATPATRVMSDRETLDLSSSAPPSGDLLAEARMMARLSHPNVLAVYEVGIANGALFVVMEHVDGCHLGRWLATPRSIVEIADVLARAGRGLAAAHARGIVHRDFKPENVLVGKDGRVCVADFGLSQLEARGSRGLVRLASTAGTPGFLAPELLRGERATTAADVFAFATTVAEALAGRPIAPSLQRAIAAGLVDDAGARCSLEVLIEALQTAATSSQATRCGARAMGPRSARPTRPRRRCPASAATLVAAAAGGEGARRHCTSP